MFSSLLDFLLLRDNWELSSIESDGDEPPLRSSSSDTNVSRISEPVGDQINTNALEVANLPETLYSDDYQPDNFEGFEDSTAGTDRVESLSNAVVQCQNEYTAAFRNVTHTRSKGPVTLPLK